MFHFQPVTVATGSADSCGQLIFRDDALVALLVRLDEDIHGASRGRWNLEAVFAVIDVSEPPLFVDAQEAADWLVGRLSPPTPRLDLSQAGAEA